MKCTPPRLNNRSALCRRGDRQAGAELRNICAAGQRGEEPLPFHGEAGPWPEGLRPAFVRLHGAAAQELLCVHDDFRKKGTIMAEKLKIISLGGLNEIGKNLTVYEYGNDIIVIDCGMGFPDDDMYGIDVVIPDVSYLIKNQSKIRGIFITHGHEDHIGAIPYVLRSVNAPIYATRMSAGLIQLKLEEHHLVNKTKMITCEAGDVIQAGKFSVEFIHVNHSIADAVAFAIKSPVGTIVHTGDFKIDTTPIQGGMIDLARFGALGKEGVLALLADSTNVERPGYTRSESSVGNSFDVLFKGCQDRIIVTTFASNVDRLQQIINVAARYGRKVAITGRSMENAMKVSTELGYMNIPDGVLMDLNQIKSLPKNKVCIITTGSQGETMSALSRMAFSTHRQVDIQPGDKVIISASTIPGNENAMGNVINELYRKGAEVVNERSLPLHVSGHACQEELKIIHGLVKPKFFIPVHGEQRHLKIHARLAQEMGMAPDRAHPQDLQAGGHRHRGQGVRGRLRRGRRGQRGAAGPPPPGPGRHGGGRGLHVRRGRGPGLRPGHHHPRLCVREGVRGAHGRAAPGGPGRHHGRGHPVRHRLVRHQAVHQGRPVQLPL